MRSMGRDLHDFTSFEQLLPIIEDELEAALLEESDLFILVMVARDEGTFFQGEAGDGDALGVNDLAGEVGAELFVLDLSPFMEYRLMDSHGGLLYHEDGFSHPT